MVQLGAIERRIDKLEEKVDELQELRGNVSVLHVQMSTANSGLDKLSETLSDIDDKLDTIVRDQLELKQNLTWLKRIVMTLLVAVLGTGGSVSIKSIMDSDSPPAITQGK